jgi:fucose 4-O-acetylase-like acetyltransferase
MSKRIRIIDVAKGMNILLVAFGHSHLIYQGGLGNRAGLVGALVRSLMLFRMPFFFFLSGIFFDTSKKFRQVAVDKTDALLKPYFVTLLLVLLKRDLFENAPVLRTAPKFLYGVGTLIERPWIPMWYLTHLWILFLFCWLLVRVTKYDERSPYIQWGVLYLLFFTGVASMRFFGSLQIRLGGQEFRLPGLPFSLDLVFVSAVFFLIGHTLRELIIYFKPRVTPAMAALAGFFLLNLLFEPVLDLNLRVLSQPIFTLMCAFAGIYISLCAAYYLSKVNKIGEFLSFAGSISLFILIFHVYFGDCAFRLMSQWAPGAPVEWVAGASCAFSILFPMLIGWIVRQNYYLSLLYLPIKRIQPFQKASKFTMALGFGVTK